MADMKHPKQDLDDMFAQAQHNTPAPSAELMSRVLGDAITAQPVVAATKTPARLGLFARISDVLGGWPAMGGLVTATVLGFLVGVSPQERIGDPAAALFEQPGDALALFDAGLNGLGWDMEEEAP